MTAALAAAAGGATMASSSSGLTAARFLSRSFLRKSGRDSLFQAPRAPGPAGPRVLVQAAAGPSGQDLGGGPGSRESPAPGRGPSGVEATLLDTWGRGMT